MAVSLDGRSRMALGTNQWRRRKLVVRYTPTTRAASRTVRDSSTHCRYNSQHSFLRRRASGVPVRALYVRRQPRQRNRCSPLAWPQRYDLG